MKFCILLLALGLFQMATFMETVEAGAPFMYMGLCSQFGTDDDGEVDSDSEALPPGENKDEL